MKKTSLLYAAACLLSGMTLCLSSCSDDDPRTDSGVEEAFFEKFKKEQLAVALEHLEENDRTLLMFRFGRNMSLKDIAVLMGISEETAKKRSQRAIKKLKKKLEEIER